MDQKKEIEIAIAALWEKHKETISLRLVSIEQAAAAFSEEALQDELRVQAQGAAHKLAGSLGTFGLHQGSRLAKEAEELLAAKSSSPGDAERLSAIAAALRQELRQKDAGI